MLVTKVSPNSRYIHIATPELCIHAASQAKMLLELSVIIYEIW